MKQVKIERTVLKKKIIWKTVKPVKLSGRTGSKTEFVAGLIRKAV